MPGFPPVGAGFQFDPLFVFGLEARTDRLEACPTPLRWFRLRSSGSANVRRVREGQGELQAVHGRKAGPAIHGLRGGIVVSRLHEQGADAAARAKGSRLRQRRPAESLAAERTPHEQVVHERDEAA